MVAADDSRNQRIWLRAGWQARPVCLDLRQVAVSIGIDTACCKLFGCNKIGLYMDFSGLTAG
ncbi:MAG: hypothetical protein DCC49_07825 [Acidobacteria bacterium]|nr:MAG: hypothetical protein DCC49_07825 [Acidobacteriota bacterium]